MSPSPAPGSSSRPPPAWRRWLLRAATLALLVLAAGTVLSRWWEGQAAADFAVSLEQARAELEAGEALLIDIREPDEHATGVAPGALLVPMRELRSRIDLVPADPAARVLLICNTQNRSRATLLYLHGRGLTHVRYVHGGMSEWARRGWPLVPPGG